MELVIGGAYQGKKNYIINLYNLKESNVAEGYLSKDKLVINSLEKIVYNLMKENKDAYLEVEKFINNNDDKVFICTEVGGGLVPIQSFDREYRETLGRITTLIAQKSKKVHRVWCGIGEIIKDV